jgi:hypothetical protein
MNTTKKRDLNIKMGFKNYQLKNFDVLETHPGRVTRKDASMGSMVHSTNSVGHSNFYPFTNPQMHERRPNPQRFHRQTKFSQAAYRRNSFACCWLSKTDIHSRVVARHLFFDMKKFASLETFASSHSGSGQGQDVKKIS